MQRDSRYQFEPFRLCRGARQTVKLTAGSFGAGAKVVATRGRARYFETAVEFDEFGNEFVELDVGADAIEGYYTLVVTVEGGKPVVVRNAFMVLDPQHHDGAYPMLEEYEKWGYVIAEDGVPMKDMAGAVGFVRHPLVVTYFLTEYYQRLSKNPSREDYREGVKRLLAWLRDAVSDGPRDSLLLRHLFPLDSFDLPSGWVSGLTQGRVAECFLIGEKITGEEEYLRLAARMMEIYHVPVSEGGLLAIDKLGYVSIEEYPSEPASWALNGIGSAIASLENIAYVVGLDWAEDLIERVCDALEAKIPLFDAPDYPGSKVQLALKRRLGFAFAPNQTPQAVIARVASKVVGNKLTHVDESKANLLRVTFTPPLSDPYDVEFSLDKDKANDALALKTTPVWRDGFVDGNIDCDDRTASHETSATVEIEAFADGVFTAYVKNAENDVVVFERSVKAGCQTFDAKIDWNSVYDGGVGRVARFNEYYHETNLAWMWNISRYGAKLRLTHVMRRWLLSFYLGIGRLPHDGSDLDVSPLQNELVRSVREYEKYVESPDSPIAKSIACKNDTIGFVLAALKGEIGAACTHSCPHVVMAGDLIRIAVYGHGFDGRERAVPVGEDFPFRQCRLVPVSGDEAILECQQPIVESLAFVPLSVDIVSADGVKLEGQSTVQFNIGNVMSKKACAQPHTRT